MSLFVVGILKIVLLEALAGLLVAAALFDRTPATAKGFNRCFLALAALAWLGYFNFGFFRLDGGMVNVWEQFHFQLGSKYFAELRYDGIYLATVAAAAESSGRDFSEIVVRDPMTFELHRVADVGDRLAEVRARFGPERWRAFRTDTGYFFDEAGLEVGVLRDHGNTGSPSWAAMARLFTAWWPANRASTTLLGFVDVVLLIALLVLAARWTSVRVAAITCVLVVLAPRAYDWLGASVLRLDWLVALGLAAAALHRGRDRLAGLALGWAIASKPPFGAACALALGAQLVIEAIRQRRVDRRQVEVVAATAVGLLAAVLAGAAAFGDLGVWTDYWQRILATFHEHYYAINHSFRDLYLQATVDGPASWLDPWPEAVAAADDRVHVGDHRWGFLAARLLLAGALVWVISRHRDRTFALALGPLLAFVLFVSNMYYWLMLGLIGFACARRLTEDRRCLIYTLAVALHYCVAYVFEHYGSLGHLQGYFGSWCLLVLCLLFVAVELIHRIPSHLERQTVPRPRRSGGRRRAAA